MTIAVALFSWLLCVVGAAIAGGLFIARYEVPLLGFLACLLLPGVVSLAMMFAFERDEERLCFLLLSVMCLYFGGSGARRLFEAVRVTGLIPRSKNSRQ